MDLPDPGIELGSPALQADSYQWSYQGSPQLEWPSSKKTKKKTHKNLQTINAGEDVEKREPSCTVSGNVNSYSYYEEQYGDFFKN